MFLIWFLCIWFGKVRTTVKRMLFTIYTSTSSLVGSDLHNGLLSISRPTAISLHTPPQPTPTTTPLHPFLRNDMALTNPKRTSRARKLKGVSLPLPACVCLYLSVCLCISLCGAEKHYQIPPSRSRLAPIAPGLPPVAGYVQDGIV